MNTDKTALTAADKTAIETILFSAFSVGRTENKRTFKEWYEQNGIEKRITNLFSSQQNKELIEENEKLRWGLNNAIAEERVKNDECIRLQSKIKELEKYLQAEKQLRINVSVMFREKESQLQESQQLNERLVSGNDKEIRYASMVFRNVQTASKAELILKPNHMNDVYTWKQIQDAILTDNDKIALLQSTTQEKGGVKISYCKGEALGGHCVFGKAGNTCNKDCETTNPTQ